MAIYVKRPTTINAEKVSHLIALSVDNWQMLPQWFRDAYNKGGVVITATYIRVPTNHGPATGELNDYIICSDSGELYPCNEETFNHNYLKI